MEVFLMLLGEIGCSGFLEVVFSRRPAYWGRGTPSWVASSTVPGGGAWAGLNAPLSRCHRKSKLIATAFTRRRRLASLSSFPQPFIPLVLRLDSTFCFIACNLDSAISPGNSHVRVVTFSECP
ncbi:unnamed protein product [Brassica oleracea var. botrytis]